MDKDDKLRLAEIHAMVKTISVDLQFLRRHRNVLFGTPVLEFNEVCSVLHLSARQVQRLRERKELVGFNVGRRRLYFQTEIYDYLSRLERKPQTSRTVNGTVIMDRPNNPSETKYLLIGKRSSNVFCAAIIFSARGFWLSNISAVTATVRCTCQPRACAKCSALRATSWTSTA